MSVCYEHNYTVPQYLSSRKLFASVLGFILKPIEHINSEKEWIYRGLSEMSAKH